MKRMTIGLIFSTYRLIKNTSTFILATSVDILLTAWSISRTALWDVFTDRIKLATAWIMIPTDVIAPLTALSIILTAISDFAWQIRTQLTAFPKALHTPLGACTFSALQAGKTMQYQMDFSQNH